MHVSKTNCKAPLSWGIGASIVLGGGVYLSFRLIKWFRQPTLDQARVPTPQVEKTCPLAKEPPKIRTLVFPLPSPPPQIKGWSKETIYYGYGAEGVKDVGWGCAWRCMQTCFSSLSITKTFQECYQYGSREKLESTYGDSLPDGAWCPHERGSPNEAWGEPFSLQMMLKDHDIDSDLFLINGFSKNMHTPQTLFKPSILYFQGFRVRLEYHFTRHVSSVTSPIMLDDGLYTYNIIGYGFKEGVTTLWIADPHAWSRISDVSSLVYTIQIDSNGSLIGDKGHWASRGFEEGSNWMVLLPYNWE